MSDKLTSLKGFGEGDPKPEGKSKARMTSYGWVGGRKKQAHTTAFGIDHAKSKAIHAKMGKK